MKTHFNKTGLKLIETIFFHISRYNVKYTATGSGNLVGANRYLQEIPGKFLPPCLTFTLS